jgi:PIN domain nuclease of toxin-antitoxin system
MRLLLDTNVVIRAVYEPSRLPAAVADTLREPENAVFFSAAVVWELAIKSSLGKLSYHPEPARRGLAARGFVELPITGQHGEETHGLPWLHRDPFDRIMIAQARVESLVLVTTDRQLSRYNVQHLLV